MKLQSDLREFIELLNSKGVEYVVVGGHAVAHHGYPRFTGDIDFLIRTSPGNDLGPPRVEEGLRLAHLHLEHERHGVEPLARILGEAERVGEVGVLVEAHDGHGDVARDEAQEILDEVAIGEPRVDVLAEHPGHGVDAEARQA